MSIDLPIEGLMQRELLECSPLTTVGEAAARMRQARCGSILVVDGGEPVGIWTESDALHGLWHSAADLDRPIAGVMSSPVKTIAARATLGEAARRLREERVRHLLVEDVYGRPVGMISQTDVVRHQSVAYFLHERDVSSVVHKAPLCVPDDTSFLDFRGLLAEHRQDALVVQRGSEFGIITARDVIGALGARQMDVQAGDLASFPLRTIASDASLLQARDIFAANGIRHLGVVDAAGKLVGLLSFRDILDNIEQEYVHGLLTQLEEQAEKLRGARRAIARQAELTETILGVLPIGVFVKDETGRLTVANEIAAGLIGRRPDEVVGRTSADLFNDAQAQQIEADDAAVRAAASTVVREEALEDGRFLLVHRRAVSVGGASLLIGAAMDVTAWKRADALMVSSHHVLELIAQGAELPTVLADLCRRIEGHLPGALCSILLLDAAGRHLHYGAAPSLPEAYCQQTVSVPVGPLEGSCGAAVHLGAQMIDDDIVSSPRWVKYADLAERFDLRACWSTPFFSSQRQILGTFAIYHRRPCQPAEHDLQIVAHAVRLAAIAVERWQQISELRQLATIDQLTGLWNRAHFIAEAESEVGRSRRFQHELSVLMVDIDHFKQINDRFGHAAGDEALRVFARLLGEATRTVDFTGRLGGEEFAVLLPETGIGNALLVAERLRTLVEAHHFSWGNESEIALTVSIGVAVLREGDVLDRMLARADEALYRAKNDGRNRIVCS